MWFLVLEINTDPGIDVAAVGARRSESARTLTWRGLVNT
jgi:hypothetical protein